jgi:hypothetical protein
VLYENQGGFGADCALDARLIFWSRFSVSGWCFFPAISHLFPAGEITGATGWRGFSENIFLIRYLFDLIK